MAQDTALMKIISATISVPYKKRLFSILDSCQAPTTTTALSQFGFRVEQRKIKCFSDNILDNHEWADRKDLFSEGEFDGQ